ncbi:MAG: LysM peptidoglycan-binding domain-containing protein [Chrysiogenetes bacterium]|nr:LysM peptidoglycan-binding domain-containing protein [Chrysiogenetes bacterium]
MLNFRTFVCLCLVLNLSACAGVFGCPDCPCECPVAGDAVAQAATGEPGAITEAEAADEADSAEAAAAEVSTEEDQGEINEAMAGELELIPDLPSDLPEVTPEENEQILSRLEGFFSQPDAELGEQIDDLVIYRGIPPEGEKVPDDYIPMLLNSHVERWILYFTGKGQKHFNKWLARLPRWQGMFERILEEEGVPRDLVYLAMIESGFSTRAYSRARAVGPWQFMRATGRMYDLHVNWWTDERRDPVKATRAAARHLRDLHDEFGSWYLAAAAYNAGGGKIRRGLARYNVTTFWELLNHRYLRSETREYVPKMLAAMILAKAPERFGFVGIEPEEAYEYETVEVPPSTDLAILAKAVDESYQTIHDLNPHYRRWFTPPEGSHYEVRIPKGKSALFAENFEKLNKGKSRTFLTHKVRKGETLSQLAYMYQTDQWAIKRLNRIGRYLRAGQTIQIPVRPGTKPKKPPARLASASRMLQNTEYKTPKGYAELLHVVERGDSLWSVSRRFGVTISDIKRWNEIPGGNRIMPGDVITVYLPEDSAEAFKDTTRVRVKDDAAIAAQLTTVKYKVRRGDTGWGIAKKHGVAFQDFQTWNPKVDWRTIKPGQELQLRVPRK